MKPTLTLYVNSYCHLCEEMAAQLLRLQGSVDFALEVVDVEGRPELEAAYAERLPVLLGSDVEICHFHLDAEAVRAYLSAG